MNLKTPVSKVFWVGPSYAQKLKRLEIETIGDLLYHFPFRYLDYSLISPIVTIQPGEVVTVNGLVFASKNEYTRRGFTLQKIAVKDETGQIEALWFNQPFLIKNFRLGQRISLAGKAEKVAGGLRLISPDYEITDKKIHTGRLVPIYHETTGITSRWLRSRIASLISQSTLEIQDFLPCESLMPLKEALQKRHFPRDEQEAEKARRRFAFEEMFLLQLAVLKRKKEWQTKKLAYPLKIEEKITTAFVQSLPFRLTGAQERVVGEILADLKKPKPMNRLLEGDVGSGKTVVAAAAILTVVKNKLQAALMVPTEILAQQHYETLKQLLESFGIKIELVTRNTQPVTRNSQFDLIIGTQALLYRQNLFQKLGLLIVDEQHRFGVKQRNELLARAVVPHSLTMTATPIPRSVALTLFGNLDLSVIDELPQKKARVKTWVVPATKRTAAYEWIKKQVREKEGQGFIICPLIEGSEKENLQTVRAVKKEAVELAKIFAGFRLALLHGRLTSLEKKKILEEFRQGKLDFLVSTLVIEVGIDLPGATIIVIEGAERFGLAQLHQLRGRVGRGKKQGYCLLFTTEDKGNNYQRLKALEKIDLGFKLAELDLQLRGAGEIYGLQQHGFRGLKNASFTDLPLIEETKQAAEEVWPKLETLPCLQEKLKESKIISP